MDGCLLIAEALDVPRHCTATVIVIRLHASSRARAAGAGFLARRVAVSFFLPNIFILDNPKKVPLSFIQHLFVFRNRIIYSYFL